MENAVLRRDGGQLVTGSFMDYAMPRADDMPVFRDAMHSVPATTNPLGVKGVGRSRHHRRDRHRHERGRRRHSGGAGAHLDMPATPEKVWQACHKAKQQ